MATVLLPRKTKFGDYKLTGFIGSGGFSDVYQAEGSDGQKVAIKVLRVTDSDLSSVAERFGRERDILSLLGSRNVSKLVAADLDADQPWIASEYISGETLRGYVERVGPVQIDIVKTILASLSVTLRELHNQGIAHRDVTPSNIILGPDGPTLIDFGASRYDLEHLATGTIAAYGTPGFMSPEAEEQRQVGAPADMYGLGRVAMFMLLGEDFQTEEIPIEDEGLREFIHSVTEQNPNDRPTAETVSFELGPLSASNAGVWARLYAERQIKKLPHRVRPATAIGLAALSAAIAFGLAFTVFANSQISNHSLTVQDVLLSSDEKNLELETFTTSGGTLNSLLVPEGLQIKQIPVFESDLYLGYETRPDLSDVWSHSSYKYIDAYASHELSESFPFLNSYQVVLEATSLWVRQEIESLPSFTARDSLPITEGVSQNVKFALDSLSYIENFGNCQVQVSDEMLAISNYQLVVASVIECDELEKVTIIFMFDSILESSLTFMFVGGNLVIESLLSGGFIKHHNDPYYRLGLSETEQNITQFAGYQGADLSEWAILEEVEYFRTFVYLEPLKTIKIEQELGLTMPGFKPILTAHGFFHFESEELVNDCSSYGCEFIGTKGSFNPSFTDWGMGRWYIEGGEKWLITNPDEYPIVIMLDIKSSDFFPLAGLTIQEVNDFQDQPFLSSLNYLPESWDEYCVNYYSEANPVSSGDCVKRFDDDSLSRFKLPLVQKPVFGSITLVNGEAIPIISSWPSEVFGTSEQTLAFRANEFTDGKGYYDGRYFQEHLNYQAHDPGLTFIMGESFEAAAGSYDQSTGLRNDFQNCGEQTEWQRPFDSTLYELLILRVAVHTNCQINNEDYINVFQDQASPIFEFQLSEILEFEGDYRNLILGRFVPGDIQDLLHFWDFLDQLIEKADLIASIDLLSDSNGDFSKVACEAAFDFYESYSDVLQACGPLNKYAFEESITTDACVGNDFIACDLLWEFSLPGSEGRETASSCNNRQALETTIYQPFGNCALYYLCSEDSASTCDLQRSERLCRAMTLNYWCDVLYFNSPEDSNQEQMGLNCGSSSGQFYNQFPGQCSYFGCFIDQEYVTNKFDEVSCATLLTSCSEGYEPDCYLLESLDIDVVSSQCIEGDMESCDRLYLVSEPNSRFEKIGSGCGDPNAAVISDELVMHGYCAPGWETS